MKNSLCVLAMVLFVIGGITNVVNWCLSVLLLPADPLAMNFNNAMWLLGVTTTAAAGVALALAVMAPASAALDHYPPPYDPHKPPTR